MDRIFSKKFLHDFSLGNDFECFIILMCNSVLAFANVVGKFKCTGVVQCAVSYTIISPTWGGGFLMVVCISIPYNDCEPSRCAPAIPVTDFFPPWPDCVSPPTPPRYSCELQAASWVKAPFSSVV